ncbi:MAG: NAD(P)-dependent oxidoreductase [Bacteroidia bacterium]
MTLIKAGIIREEKIPHEKRVALTPDQCKLILQEYRNVEITVQPCDYRCYTNDEYTAAGIVLKEDVSHCDALFGIKEVPLAKLIPQKKYLFFSHTVKQQPHNRQILKTILDKKIQLIDYECMVDKNDNRVIGFGRFAGIVGAYNGLMAYGKKYNLFELKPAHLCHDKKELYAQTDQVRLPNIKIVVTGSGRVANGACETMGAMNIRRVTPYEFLNYTFREAVYTQLHSEDYYVAKDKSPFSAYEFHHHPEDFTCTFSDSNSYTTMCDLLIHCTYWDPRADILFTKSRMRDPDFRTSVIADVTCDLNGSIPSTTRLTTIENKFCGYDPITELMIDPFDKKAITMMAIDNLPCELPRDSSEGFGKHLFERVLPSLFGNDNDGLIERASITKDGKLTERFGYLKDYVNGF